MRRNVPTLLRTVVTIDVGTFQNELSEFWADRVMSKIVISKYRLIT